MDYINSGFAGLLCAFGSIDDLSVQETHMFVDTETDEMVDSYKCEENHTYKYKKVWSIHKGYKSLKHFLTEEAKSEYNRIVDELRKDNKVIDM